MAGRARPGGRPGYLKIIPLRPVPFRCKISGWRPGAWPARSLRPRVPAEPPDGDLALYYGARRRLVQARAERAERAERERHLLAEQARAQERAVSAR
jgi:hypothetical protein